MTMESLIVPDLGGAEQVEIIEILVAVGDQVAAEDGIIVLETDKATMEIPSPLDGTIAALTVKVGDKISEGDQYGEIELSSAPEASSESAKQEKAVAQEIEGSGDGKAENKTESKAESKAENNSTPNNSTAKQRIEIVPIPDLGGSEQVEVIELLVNVGDEVDEDQSIFTLETDKASMEIPAGKSGRIEKILLALGDKVSAGDAMLELSVFDSVAVEEAPEKNDQKTTSVEEISTDSDIKSEKTLGNTKAADRLKETDNIKNTNVARSAEQVHAGPVVRKLARELGVDLTLVKGSGIRDRITKDDVHSYVKSTLQNPEIVGSSIPKVAEIDFSQFGEVETEALNKIKLATAKNMTAAWLNAPQVTQFDQADITELEKFRKQINARPENEQKLSAVPFVMKALALIMKEFPQFNASLSPDGQSLIYKKYIHIGVAVDTPKGLLVPVIRDVDQKSVTEIAQDLNDKAQMARAGKLGLKDMQGGCFSLSSLGGIGGTAFTPIVNAPEVAILGLSRAEMKPAWNGNEFVPKLMLPLSLSYDHRVIDGAEAARFSQRLATVLGDIRYLIL